MAGFTITIEPDNDDGAQTCIQVDTATGSARITELTVRAAGGGALSAEHLAGVNLDALIAALAPSGPEEITASTQSTAPAGQPDIDGEPSPPPAPAGSSPLRTRVKTGRKANAKQAPSRTRQAKADMAAAQASSGRRAYRRMPDPSEVLDAYRQVGGTTALARHYGVPRHTATGWLRRLRSMGQL